MRTRGSRWCGGRRAVALALVLGAALVLRVPLHSRLSADFPRLSPRALAHFLADFSNYPKLYPDIYSWSVEEESGNYTSWRYSVSYSCGERCVGRVEVWHGEEGAGAGGGRHLLRVVDERCSHLPLLPFPRFCAEGPMGARLAESARGACGPAQALLGRCRLAARRRRHLDALRLALA
ncbi:unnamed protein product, partial [Iphiclides podalirius]